MPRKFDWSRDYLRAASQRYEAALILQRNGKYLDAVYLGGYGIECALKALLMTRTPMKDRDSVLKVFRGRTRHDLLALRTALRGRGVRFPEAVARGLTRVEGWSTDLRYETATMKHQNALAFLVAVDAIIEWVGRSV